MLTFLFYSIASLVAFLIFLYVMQRRLIYFPMGSAPSPAEAGVPEMSVVDIHTTDGLTLKAWYRPPLQPHLPTLVYFHGNAGHIGYRAFLVKPYLNEGYGVLLLTYRGYSGNPGKPYEEGLYNDGRAAMDFLGKQRISEKRTIFYGESIGCAVALQIATERSVGAIILQSPFTSLTEVGQFHFPIIPMKWFMKDKYDSLKIADKIHAPILIIHGLNDDIIPIEFGKKLFSALSEPKRMEYIPKSGHNDLFQPTLAIDFIRACINSGSC